MPLPSWENWPVHENVPLRVPTTPALARTPSTTRPPVTNVAEDGVAMLAETVIETAPVEAVTTSVVEPDLDESAVLWAVMVTGFARGRIVGAV